MLNLKFVQILKTEKIGFVYKKAYDPDFGQYVLKNTRKNQMAENSIF